MSNIKVAVIGVYNIGKNHLRSWLNTEGVQVVSIADLNPQLLVEVQQEFNISESYQDYRTLLERSDAEIVSVCLPTALHEQVVMDCLQSGRHVICEKPPSTHASAAQRMYECSLKVGKNLGYSLQRRFSTAVQSVRHAVEVNRVGDLIYAKAAFVRHAPLNFRNSMWRFDKNSGGGSLLDLGIHMLDAAWYAMGCPQPIAALGHTSSAQVPEFCKLNDRPVPEGPAEDTAIAWIRFANEAILVLESSFGMWNFDEEVERCELYGTNGALRMYPGTAKVIDRQGSRILEAPSVAQGHRGVMKDFLESVRNGHPPCVDGMQGVILHKMLDAVVQSAAIKQEVLIR